MSYFYIDSHCHLEDQAFDNDRDEVYQRALEAKVSIIILAGSDIETSKKIVNLTKKYPGVYGLVGVHPHEAKEVSSDYLEELSQLLNEPKILGVGEIGLDYYYEHSPREVQKKVFGEQLDLAEAMGKPFAIHSREATADTLEVIKAKQYHKGVFHCYSYSVETLREILDLGYYISLGGAVTFKNAKRPVEVGAAVPLERLLLETDAPYLTPVPYRGKRNEPAYVVKVAEKIAAIKKIDVAEVAKATWQNSEDFFETVFNIK